jgi:mgtE-like transporter
MEQKIEKSARKHPAHRHLKKLQKIKRKHYHPIIHEIHKKHNISKKTLFYVKEYGPHSHIPQTIIRESLRILLFASLISSLGGLTLENIKNIFVTIVPLIVALPVINDMIGDYGTVVSSKFSTMLHEGLVKTKWWKTSELRKLFLQIIVISTVTALLVSAMALAIGGLSNYFIDVSAVTKITLVIVFDVIILVCILFLMAVFAGLYFFRKGEDPNNFLIPITTSIADFGNMCILSILVILIF